MTKIRAVIPGALTWIGDHRLCRALRSSRGGVSRSAPSTHWRCSLEQPGWGGVARGRHGSVFSPVVTEERRAGRRAGQMATTREGRIPPSYLLSSTELVPESWFLGVTFGRAFEPTMH